MSIKDGGPAFPGGDGEHVGNPQYYTPGMSLRDYFAAKALEGMLACPSSASLTNHGGSLAVRDFARWAYGYADAMLRARCRGGDA